MPGGLLDVVTRVRGGVGADGERALPLTEQEREPRAGVCNRRIRSSRVQLCLERGGHGVRVDSRLQRRDDDVDGCIVLGYIDRVPKRAFALHEHVRRGGVVVESDAKSDGSGTKFCGRWPEFALVVHARGEVVALGVPPEEEYRCRQCAGPTVYGLPVGTSR